MVKHNAIAVQSLLLLSPLVLSIGDGRRSTSTARADVGRSWRKNGRSSAFSDSKGDVDLVSVSSRPPRRRRRRRSRFRPALLRNNQLMRSFLSGRRDGNGGAVAPMPMESKQMQKYLTCFAIVFAWISLATLFYSTYYSWPLPQSFFYAVDAGMSIGFCTAVEETEVASRAFTIVHILLGASCVGGALILLVQSVLDGVASREASIYRLILERDAFEKAFKSGGSDGGDVNRIGSNFWNTQPKADLCLSYPDFRNVLANNGLEGLSDVEFRRVCRFYDSPGEGRVRLSSFAERFEGVHRILPQSRSVRHASLPRRALDVAWTAASSLVTDEHRRIFLIFLLWVGLGIAWGIVDQGWDPVTATHFAVSALATGGLTAPPVDPVTGILPTGPALFCGLYCLFGIPLMALTLGIFAGALVEGHVVEEELAAIARPLSRSEFAFASKSLCSRDDALHLSDYIVLQLMRQGKLNLESFEFMKSQYQLLDRRPAWLRSVGPD